MDNQSSEKTAKSGVKNVIDEFVGTAQKKTAGQFAWLTKNIKSDLLEKSFDGRMFFSGSDDVKGLLTNCYGLSTLMLLLNYSEERLTPSQQESTVAVIGDILAHLDSRGYDLSPYFEDKSALFTKSSKVTRSMSAVMIAFTFCRLAEKRKSKLVIPAAYRERMAERIREVLVSMTEDVIKSSGGQERGYGPTSSCANNVSLGDTYALVEAFSRFEDAFLKNDENKRDPAFVRMVDPDGTIIPRARQTIRQVALYTYKYYKNLYGYKLFYSDRTECVYNQIAASNRSSVLFCSLYVALITMMGYTDVELVVEDLTKGGMSREQALAEYQRLKEQDELMDKKVYRDYQNETNDAIDLVNINYRKFRDGNKIQVVDTDYIEFTEGLDSRELVRLNKMGIEASYLRPLLLSAKCMIVYSLIQYPQQEMGILYEEILASRRVEDGKQLCLWNDDDINIYATERNVTAIAYDYFYYFEEYEMFYRAFRESDNAVKRCIDERVEAKIKNIQNDFDLRSQELAGQLKSLTEKSAAEKETLRGEFENSNRLVTEISKISGAAASDSLIMMLDGAIVLSCQACVNEISACECAASEIAAIAGAGRRILDGAANLNTEKKQAYYAEIGERAKRFKESAIGVFQAVLFDRVSENPVIGSDNTGTKRYEVYRKIADDLPVFLDKLIQGVGKKDKGSASFALSNIFEKDEVDPIFKGTKK